MLEYANDRREAKRLAADSVRAAKLLTGVHLENFPEAVAPVAPVPPSPSRWQRLRRGEELDLAALEQEYADANVRWERLRRHDPDEVIGTVDDALADNSSQSACIDAGGSDVGNYVTLVVHYPGPEIAEGIVQAGANTRPRSEKEQIDLYRRAVASTVVATAKEALACAPAAKEAYVVVLRYDAKGRFKKKASELDAIYAGAIDRTVLAVDWSARTPIDVMLGARAVRVDIDRKGRFKPLGDDAGDDLRALVAAIVTAREAGRRVREVVRRYSTDESQRLMQTQERQAFVALSECPGCGELDTHALRDPRQGDPEWSAAIRVCAVCQREWAQA